MTGGLPGGVALTKLMELIMAKANDGKAKFLEVVRDANVPTRLEFKLGDGAVIRIDANDFSDEIKHQAMMHGFNQKIRDASSSYGKDRDFEGAFEEMMKVVEGLQSGSWNRQGGGIGAGVVMEDLAFAISTIKQVDMEKAMAAVKKASPEQRNTWAKNAKVAKLMADNKAARLAKLAESATDDIDVDLSDTE